MAGSEPREFCLACAETEHGRCLLHQLPPGRPLVAPGVRYRAPPTRAELEEMLGRVLRHEARYWVTTPFKSLGCNYCGRPWGHHDPDCLWLEASRLIGSER